MDSEPPFKTHPLLDSQNVVHGFFGRRGGVSKTRKEGNFASLNVGQGSSDKSADIAENRRRVALALGTRRPNPRALWQYHSTEVLTITQTDWARTTEADRPKADGHVTQIPGIALSALSADCGPVLFFDPVSKTIGACHAGWRGAIDGITDATLQAMQDLGAKRETICAVLGPCISQQNYEVGPEFEATFVKRDAKNAEFFKACGADARAHFDLKAYIAARLKSQGLSQIAVMPDCTYGQPELYYSYRYNTHHGLGDYGRNISAIMLTE